MLSCLLFSILPSHVSCTLTAFSLKSRLFAPCLGHVGPRDAGAIDVVLLHNAEGANGEPTKGLAQGMENEGARGLIVILVIS